MSVIGKNKLVVARVSSPTLPWIFQEANFSHSYSCSHFPTRVHGYMGTEIHSTEHLEHLSLAVNMRESRKRHVGALNHHWNWALALGINLLWEPLIPCEFRWNCHQQDKCIWRTWPCRTGLTLLMLFTKCWVWKILPEVQMCLSIRDLSLVLLMQMQTFLKVLEEMGKCSGDFWRITLSP